MLVSQKLEVLLIVSNFYRVTLC